MYTRSCGIVFHVRFAASISSRTNSSVPLVVHPRSVFSSTSGAMQMHFRLLAIGATAVDGRFERGEVVSVVAPDGTEIARGLVNYAAGETARILRKPTSEIEAVLGYIAEPELIHRDNLVIL